jgi:P-type conjugative transfer protein TrbJ
MHKRVIAIAIVCGLVLQRPEPVRAGAFATEFTQVLNHGQLVMEYIRQGQQLATQIDQYKDQLRNVKNLPSQVFGSITADLNSLAGIVQGGQALAYSLAGLDAKFRTVFTGYGTNPNAYYPNYKKWASTTLDTTLSTLKAVGLQGSQLQSEQSVLNQLRSMAQSSDGRMQALQVMGQIAEQQTQQLMKLRQILLVDLQSKQAYQAAVIQQQASEHAATEQFFKHNPASGDGRVFRPGVN